MSMISETYKTPELRKVQCDKCKEYIECPFLNEWLKLWRKAHKHRVLTMYISDGVDIAKICWKFQNEKVHSSGL